MFVERLTDEECIELAKHYMIRCKEATWYIDKNSMERDNGVVSFNFEIYEDVLDWVIMEDFDLTLSMSSMSLSDELLQEHLKIMYRKFGKEYLDALDENHRKTIEEDNYKLSSHKNRLEDVMGDK